MKNAFRFSLLLLGVLVLMLIGPYAPAGIIPAIIPAAVPTANKIGNSAKFQLGTAGAVSGDCAQFDASLNITGPGTGAGCTGGSGITLKTNGTNNGSQSILNLAAGTNMTLTDNGSGTVTFASSGGGGGGSFTILESHTASNSASLAFTTCLSHTTTYDSYMIQFVNLYPVTDGAKIGFQMSTNGGSSYDGGSNYSWSATANVANGSPSGNGSTSATMMNVVNGQSSNAAGNPLSGSVQMFGAPASGSSVNLVGQLLGFDTSDTRFLAWVFTGNYHSTSAVNAFQVLASTGNLDTGTVRCYGLSH